ncbi:hypothetical protein FACS1894184_16880 [Clostridia bacterium]|nr:hypothetical protein FACS1894184_16880 [Clostridia bacterium]
MEASSKYKVYVPVTADFDANGVVTPRSFRWEDGRIYEVDKVMGVQAAYAQKSGGQGDRYSVRIRNQIRFLYFEHNPQYGQSVSGRWFVER